MKAQRKTERGLSCPPTTEPGLSSPGNDGLENPSSVIETEIGSYPSSWRVDRFDSLFAVQQGRQVSKANRQGDNQKPFLRTKNVFWGKLDLEDLDEMHFSASDEARLTLKRGDLLICEGGSIGRTAVWKGQLAVCYYQNHLHRARLKNDDADSSYALFWLWYAFEVGSVYFGRGNVTTIPNLSQSKLCELPLPVPPLPEQQKIAAVLGVVQRAMEQQERLLALTAELKKTLLHQLFTQGLRHEPQKQTDIGPVPESWEVVKLGELCQIKHGFAFAGEFFQPQGRYILLTPGHYHEDGGFRDQGQKTKYYTGDFPTSYILNKDDLLVVMTEQKEGLLGSSLLVPRGELYLHNQRLGLIQDLDETRLRRRFLYHLFNTPPVRKRISMTASGSKVRHTSPGKIRDTVVALPPIAHQEHAVEVLDAVDRKLDTATRKHATLTALFRTLLHELMTAKTRVHELELPVAKS